MRVGADGGGCFPTGRHYPGIAHLVKVKASGLAEEIDGETRMVDVPLVAIDTETTGRDPHLDRIVEIAAVTWRGGEVVERTHWLVNPGCPIPKEAFDVHGISDDDVKDKPPFEDIAADVLAALVGKVPVAYNAAFDRDFLRSALTRAGAMPEKAPPAARRGVEWIDPLEWARELYRDEKGGRSLSEVCARLGIDIGQAHRATDDAEAALRVHVAFTKDSRVPETYAAFVQEQHRISRENAIDRARWRVPAPSPAPR